MFGMTSFVLVARCYAAMPASAAGALQQPPKKRKQQRALADARAKVRDAHVTRRACVHAQVRSCVSAAGMREPRAVQCGGCLRSQGRAGAWPVLPSVGTAAQAELLFWRPDDEFYHKHCQWSFWFASPGEPGQDSLQPARCCMLLTHTQAQSARCAPSITWYEGQLMRVRPGGLPRACSSGQCAEAQGLLACREELETVVPNAARQ